MKHTSRLKTSKFHILQRKRSSDVLVFLWRLLAENVHNVSRNFFIDYFEYKSKVFNYNCIRMGITVLYLNLSDINLDFTVAKICLPGSATHRNVNSICNSKIQDLHPQSLKFNTVISYFITPTLLNKSIIERIVWKFSIIKLPQK